MDKKELIKELEAEGIEVKDGKVRVADLEYVLQILTQPKPKKLAPKDTKITPKMLEKHINNYIFDQWSDSDVRDEYREIFDAEPPDDGGFDDRQSVCDAIMADPKRKKSWEDGLKENIENGELDLDYVKRLQS